MVGVDAAGIEVLTFDCYGTLIDWEKGIADAFLEEAGRDGVRLDPMAVLAAYADLEPQVEEQSFRPYREVLRETARRVAARLGWTIEAERARFLEASLPSWPPFPDTNPALERLARRFRLAILSNVDADLLEATRKHIAAPFAWVVTAEQVRSYKPAPAHFEAAIHQAGGKEKIHHVGSSLFHDGDPAWRFGIPFAWVNRKGEPVPRGPRAPALVVGDLRELAGRLGG